VESISGVGVTGLVEAASAALGIPLTDPVDLGGSRRSTVLRCRSGTGETVVVKGYADEHSLRAFTAEAAGLAFAVAGPRLLAVDATARLIVMSDLGTAPSLADVLLGGDPGVAREGLLSWATGLGRLAARTVGRQDELAALRSRYDMGQSQFDGVGWLADAFGRVPTALALVGVEPAAGLDLELAGLLDDDGRYLVFSPGDVCPDNNLLAPDGLRLLDFESAGYRPVFFDAAYCRMPFATCWCVCRLPAGLGEWIEAAYRGEVVRAYPELTDDEVWHPGVRRAAVAWAFSMTEVLLPVVAAADRRRAGLTPSWRQILRYRWENLLVGVGDLPAVTETARRLLAATDGWEVPTLPGYPAFA
jgi:hypothetical protein